MGVAGEDPNQLATIEAYRPVKEWHDAPAGHSQRHALVTSFVWELPRLSHAGGPGVARALLDGWQISGEYALVSGDWAPVFLQTQDGFDFDGGDNSVRPLLIGDPTRPSGARFRTDLFNTSAFARPTGRGDVGNAPRNVVQLPGINNLNLSL